MFDWNLTSRRVRIFIFVVALSLLFVFYHANTTVFYENLPMARSFQEAEAAIEHKLLTSQVPPFLPNSCVAQLDHVYFLKTHKCGSSTVQNILMRRGLQRGLNFVLPEKANYLGHPELFHLSKHVGPSLQLPSKLMQYHILTHHSRYHAENVRLALPMDTKHITILREPASLFESLYNYYHFENLYDDRSFNDILNLPIKELRDLMISRPRYAYRVGINQMAFDLGLPKSEFQNPASIRQLIKTVEKDFQLIMLSEYMEISMVLLAEIMCWHLEDVAFVTLNARPAENRSPLTEDDIEKLNDLNSADVLIYSHFYETFKERVIQYGVRRMEGDVSKLVSINQCLMDECIQLVVPPKNNPNEYSVVKYQVKPNAPLHCKYLVLGELEFTDILRFKQKRRFETIRKLHELLGL